MAWTTSSNSNDELWDALFQLEIVDEVNRDVFKQVDRGLFIPEDSRHLAYGDAPMRAGKVHVSAPHIYATVLQALNLDKELSFLNIGSGTGYFQCVVAAKLGVGSVVHGVELQPELVSCSRTVTQRWLSNYLEEHNFKSNNRNTSLIDFQIIEGNCFSLDLKNQKYDRYYNNSNDRL